MTYCPECGVKNSENSKFCQNCGEQIKALKGSTYADNSTVDEPSPQTDRGPQNNPQSQQPQYNPQSQQPQYNPQSQQPQYNPQSQQPGYNSKSNQYNQQSQQPRYNSQSNQYNQQSQQPRYNQQPQYQQPNQYGYNQRNQYRPSRKEPALAAILSLILPGTGYIYLGDVGKGIGMFLLVLITYFFFLGIFVHIYVIYNSYTEAKRINTKNGYF